MKATAKREETIEINYMKNETNSATTIKSPLKTKVSTIIEDYNIQCFHCKEFGHIYKECPNRRSINNILTENKSKQKDENSVAMTTHPKTAIT